MRDKRIRQFVCGNILLVLLCFLLNGISGYSKSVGAEYLQKITDLLEIKETENLLTFILIGGALTFLSYVIRWLGAVVPYYLSEKFACEIRIGLFEKLRKIPFLSYEGGEKGEYLSLIQNDSDRSGQMFYILLSRVLNNLFLFGFSIWVMAKTNVRATVVVVLFILAATGINQYILRFMKKYEKAAQNNLAQMTHSLESTWRGLETIKMFQAGNYAKEGYLGRQKEYCGNRLKAAAVNACRTLWYAVVENLCLYGSVAYLGYMGLRGEMSIGSVLMFIYLIKQIIMPIEVVFRWMSTFTGSAASWERIKKQFAKEEEQETGKCGFDDSERAETDQTGVVSVSCLDFSYDGNTRVLHDVELELKRGKITGLKGQSGSGKTTLLKVLTGVYHSDTAEYRWNGSRIDSLFGRVAYGAMEHSIFPVSLYENVALGREDITKEAVRKLLSEMGFDEWLTSLPEGVDTILTGNMSGGQRQAVSTARALMSGRTMLILDEPYSALDGEKEECLTRLLLEESRKKIILISSHREEVFQTLNAEMCYLGSSRTVG